MNRNTGSRIVTALVILAATAASGCGKKGPPFVPIRLKGTILEYARVTPSRGGALVSWKEAPKLPRAPEKKSWYGYRVMRSTPGQGPVEVRSVKTAGVDGMRYEFLDLAVTAGLEYSYVVELLNEDLRVGYASPAMRIVPGSGLPAPPAPRAVAGEGRVSLAWEPVDPGVLRPNAFLGYNLFRREERGGKDYPLVRPLTPQPLSAASYLDTPLKNEQGYCYVLTVAANGPEGGSLESAPSGEVCATPRDITPPAAPEGLSYSPGAGYVILSWKANIEPDLAGYLVYRRKGEDEAFRKLTPALLLTPLFKDDALEPGEVYHYAVTAVDSSPQANESPYSTVLTLTGR